MNYERMRRPANARHKGLLLDSHGGFDVIDCEVCGFAHATPLPSAEELQRVYSETYYAIEKPDYLTRAEADAPWANMFYEDRLVALSDALGPSNSGARRLLDIGSGPGHFLRFAD